MKSVRRNIGKTLIFVTIGLLISCAGPSKKPIQTETLIRSDFSVAELKKLCTSELETFKARVDEIAKLDPNKASFEQSFLALESADADVNENLGPLTFMYAVSTDADLRKASEECQKQSSKIMIDLYSRKDLYKILKKSASRMNLKKKGASEQRLVSETLKAFRLGGLELSDSKLKKLKALKKKMSDLSTQFSANLNNNKDQVLMSEAEMKGVPDSVRGLFKKDKSGRYIVLLKGTYLTGFMKHAVSASARRKLLAAYASREAKSNTPLLSEMVELRKQAAKLLGFRNWADYRTAKKMAKTGDRAWNFLKGLKRQLKKPYLADYNVLLEAKKKDVPGSKKLDPWDSAFYSNRIRKEKYSIDSEKIREFFPAEHVLKEMFQIYSKLLSVQLVPRPDIVTWHPSVRTFEVRELTNNKLIAYFYADLYPREGKYSHAAAFTLRSGRLLENGTYQIPISAIVSNFTPPSEGRPSLLTHNEVETLFHEFGHIMHQTLTKAKYASFSGTQVARDFVEAPSQMLENWVWEPSVLKKISSHFQTKKPLTDDLIQKLIQSRKFNLAWTNMRQLVFGMYDLTLHRSRKKIDVISTYRQIYKEATNIEPMKEDFFPAAFGHLMGGYDAGYYGYLWSNVFAFDMYSQFKGPNLLSSKVGGKYRTAILEPGGMRDADELLKEFLGRKPNSKAFLNYLGL